MANEITLEDLATMMRDGFAKSEESTDKKIDNLAGMVNNGFEGVNERFDKVESQLDAVENRLSTVEQDVKDIKSHIYTETYKFEIKDLDNRVTKLEKKLA